MRRIGKRDFAAGSRFLRRPVRFPTPNSGLPKDLSESTVISKTATGELPWSGSVGSGLGEIRLDTRLTLQSGRKTEIPIPSALTPRSVSPPAFARRGTRKYRVPVPGAFSHPIAFIAPRV